MRDIPMFTTENGVASLFLKKIPFTKEAFVLIRDSLSCAALVKECIDVCHMAGAEKIYAAGHDELACYPFVCSVLRFCVSKKHLPDTQSVALPVTIEQMEWWRKLYNQKMASVQTASPLSAADAEELILSGKAFYICSECAILGIGVAYEEKIHAIASVMPGAGRDTLLALSKCLQSTVISLSVASTNEKALRLYKSLGFAETEMEMNWYQIY